MVERGTVQYYCTVLYGYGTSVSFFPLLFLLIGGVIFELVLGNEFLWGPLSLGALVNDDLGCNDHAPDPFDIIMRAPASRNCVGTDVTLRLVKRV